MAYLAECPDALTADFYRFYGDSQTRLVACGVPLLDVAAMAAHLPEGCATHRAIVPPSPDSVWTVENQLLAELVDRVGRLFAVQQAVATGKRGRIVFPDPIPRPGVTPAADRLEADRFDSTTDFAAWYAAQPGGRPIPVA